MSMGIIYFINDVQVSPEEADRQEDADHKAYGQSLWKRVDRAIVEERYWVDQSKKEDWPCNSTKPTTTQAM